MHKLNYCESLCLPESVGKYKSRGLENPVEFEGGVLVAMGGPMGPNHGIYVSRPVTEDGQVLTFNNLNSEAKVKNVIGISYAPESSVDPDPLADVAFANRDENLAMIVDAYLSNGYENVLVFSNIGIGPTVNLDSNINGVLRDGQGRAYASLVNGVQQEGYAINDIVGRAQKTAHDHVHVIGDSNLPIYTNSLINSLNQAFRRNKSMTFEDMRNYLRKNHETGPLISATLVTATTDLSIPLNHSFFFAKDSYTLAEDKVTGIVRKVLTDVTERKIGAKISGKGVNEEEAQAIKYRKKGLVQGTADFYSKIF